MRKNTWVKCGSEFAVKNGLPVRTWMMKNAAMANADWQSAKNKPAPSPLFASEPNGGPPSASQTAAPTSGRNTALGKWGTSATTNAMMSDASTTSVARFWRIAESGLDPAAIAHSSSATDTKPSIANATR